MFVITADQVDSRRDEDRAGELRERLDRQFQAHLVLPMDQNSGDEVQAILTDADPALRMILAITRTGRWSVGVGVGSVRTPLPDATRKAAGPAFIAARAAVTDAKRAEARFALRTQRSVADHAGGPNEFDPAGFDAAEIEPLVTMLLLIRARRTKPGWEVVELLEHGKNQLEIADDLHVSAAAVSQRLKSSLWKTEEAVRPTLAKLLAHLDSATVKYVTTR